MNSTCFQVDLLERRTKRRLKLTFTNKTRDTSKNSSTLEIIFKADEKHLNISDFGDYYCLYHKKPVGLYIPLLPPNGSDCWTLKMELKAAEAEVWKRQKNSRIWKYTSPPPALPSPEPLPPGENGHMHVHMHVLHTVTSTSNITKIGYNIKFKRLNCLPSIYSEVQYSIHKQYFWVFFSRKTKNEHKVQTMIQYKKQAAYWTTFKTRFKR